MQLSLGFSPCPNDTFIFDALVHQKIDTGGITFNVVLEDVQTLNEWAQFGKLNVSKISYGVLPLVLERYRVLNSGGALGKGVGPLLISKSKEINPDTITDSRIALPGINTTAHLLFSLAYPEAKNKVFAVFHEIEEMVLNGTVDAGVIIHENRFTYAAKGLHKVKDLGAYWEEQTELPIPLGGIVVNKTMDEKLAMQVDALIKKSVEYAFQNYPDLPNYVRAHASEMSEQVMRQHIDLYVNSFSIDMGEEGKKAVHKLLSVYQQLNPITATSGGNIFLNP